MGRQEIIDWVIRTADDVCGDCIDTCCNNLKHFIGVSKKELKLFSDQGVRIYSRREVDKNSVKEWFNNKTHVVYIRESKQGILGWLKSNKEKTAAEKPSLIPNRCEEEWYLYGDGNCPFYNEKKRLCKVHEDQRRPLMCRQYPVLVYDAAKPTLIGIKESCRLFNSQEIKDDLKNSFPEPEYSIVNNEGSI